MSADGVVAARVPGARRADVLEPVGGGVLVGDEAPWELMPHRSAHAGERAIFGWLSATLRLSAREVFNKAGKEALFYLRFQKYLLVLLAALTVVGCGVLLPLNLAGGRAAPCACHAGVRRA